MDVRIGTYEDFSLQFEKTAWGALGRILGGVLDRFAFCLIDRTLEEAVPLSALGLGAGSCRVCLFVYVSL